MLAFIAQIPLSAATVRQLAVTIVPMLESHRPITLAFGARARDLPPVAGLPDPARRFVSLCFGPPAT